MKKIDDTNKLNYYIAKYNFNDYFTHDFSKYTELLYFKDGDYIIREGVTSSYLYFMVEGKCRYSSVNEAGDVIIFGASKNFKIFGEAASLWNEIPKNSVQAIGDTYCLAISLHKYRDTLLNDATFLRFICKILSDRLIFANNTYSFYRSTTTENRLAAYILQYANNDIFHTNLIDLAETMGVSYRHLLRVLSSFIEEGVLKKDKRNYHIIKRKKLEDLVEYQYIYYD